jgi:hypothetical protein
VEALPRREYAASGGGGKMIHKSPCAIGFLICLASLIVAVRAPAQTKNSTTSPDGRYEVIFVEQKQDDITVARIRDKKTKKVSDTEAISWDGEIEVRWRKDSHVVALNFSAGKHTRDTLLYAADNGRIYQIEMPDFIMNILGREGAISAKFKNSAVNFADFLPNDECLLVAHVEPDDAPNPEFPKQEKEADEYSGPVDFDIKIRVNQNFTTDLLDVQPAKTAQ